MSGVQRMGPALVVEVGQEGGACCLLSGEVQASQQWWEGASTSLDALIK